MWKVSTTVKIPLYLLSLEHVWSEFNNYLDSHTV